MLPRLPIAFTQMKAGNRSGNLLNKIRQNIYSLHQAKEITKTIYNSTMNIILQYYIMNFITIMNII